MKYLAITFISGFVVMSTELIASRIIAPMIGSSVFTWTSIIGIILFGISLGNYIGGKIIDKKTSDHTIFQLILLASLFLAIMPHLVEIIKPIIFWEIPLLLKIFCISTALFLLPAIFLGTIFPSALKLYLQDKTKTGEAAGLFSGVGALGSILGVFLTGFLFIGFVGSSSSVYILSLALLLISFLILDRKSWTFWFVLAIIISLAAANYSTTTKTNVVFETESDYYKIKITDDINGATPKRLLFLDFDFHSAESLSQEKIGCYQEMAPLFKAFGKDFKKVLAIGGGSFSLPKGFVNTFGAEVDVVEIDPKVTKTAKDFFNLSTYPIKTIENDARILLATTKEKYDLIFGDAYSSFISTPWYLLTKEANFAVKERLNPGGLYAINIFSAPEEAGKRWFESIVKTFSESFPNYYMLYTNSDKKELQNIILVGVKSNEKITLEELEHSINRLTAENDLKPIIKKVSEPKSFSKNAITLSDDFAPAERLAIPQISNYFNKYINWFYSF